MTRTPPSAKPHHNTSQPTTKHNNQHPTPPYRCQFYKLGAINPTLPSGNGSHYCLVLFLLGCFAYTCLFEWMLCNYLLDTSPFVRFALSVLVARSGTLLSRVFIVACATSVGVVLTVASMSVVFCYRPRASVANSRGLLVSLILLVVVCKL